MGIHTGVYINKSLAYKGRDDLKPVIHEKGHFESTFVEITIPKKKNLIIGCLYRHPSSSVTVNHFTNDYIEPLLLNISNENKTCAIMGDFNIDLVKKRFNQLY